MAERKPSNAHFILLRGRLMMESGGTLPGDVRPGETVAETGVIPGRPRNATIRAVRTSVVARVAAAAMAVIGAGDDLASVEAIERSGRIALLTVDATDKTPAAKASGMADEIVRVARLLCGQALGLVLAAAGACWTRSGRLWSGGSNQGSAAAPASTRRRPRGCRPRDLRGPWQPDERLNAGRAVARAALAGARGTLRDPRASRRPSSSTAHCMSTGAWRTTCRWTCWNPSTWRGRSRWTCWSIPAARRRSTRWLPARRCSRIASRDASGAATACPVR